MVVTAVAIVAGYANRERLRLKIASVYASVPPKASQTAPSAPRAAGAFSGDAPWALSALPECFVQTEKATAPELRYVLAHLPRGAAMVRPPARLQYADCTLQVVRDEVLVRRGRDRMRVPPQARVYTAPGSLALLRASGGGYELRVYKVRP